jgi:hypothetical protein
VRVDEKFPAGSKARGAFMGEVAEENSVLGVGEVE